MNKIIPIHSAARYRRSIMIVDDQATSRTILRSLIQRVDSKAKLYVFDETTAADAFCRTRERTALASATPEALSNHLPLLENQVSSVWSMGKDGRSYWPVGRQAATADRLANHKGRNPRERASLKERLMRKWMSK